MKYQKNTKENIIYMECTDENWYYGNSRVWNTNKNVELIDLPVNFLQGLRSEIMFGHISQIGTTSQKPTTAWRTVRILR